MIGIILSLPVLDYSPGLTVKGSLLLGSVCSLVIVEEFSSSDEKYVLFVLLKT